MNRKVRENIEVLAGLIRDYCGMNNQTSEEDVMSILGGRITLDDKLPLDIKGTITKCGDNQSPGFIIRLSDAMNEREKRLVLFRQIGHLFLHMGYMIDEDRWQKSGEYRIGETLEEKTESDEFALDILMPASEYRKIMKQSSSEGSVDVEKIADTFKVPLEAAIRRGRRLGCLEW